jgi:hypothetical protein
VSTGEFARADSKDRLREDKTAARRRELRLPVRIVRAEVVRVVDVTTALRDAVEPSGMGLRFLDPEESSVQTLVGQWNQYATRQLRGRLRR